MGIGIGTAIFLVYILIGLIIYGICIMVDKGEMENTILLMFIMIFLWPLVLYLTKKGWTKK